MLDAPPALAVGAACGGAFGWLPELVVSGVNPGFNTGRLVLHSGTVGAALTAASRNIPGIAVSTANEDPLGLDSAATLATWLVDLLPRHRPRATTLNLNVPALPLDQLGGILDATLSETSVSDVSFEMDQGTLRVRRRENPPPFEQGTDAYLLSCGWAALSTVSSPWGAAADASTLAMALHLRWVDRLAS